MYLNSCRGEYAREKSCFYTSYMNFKIMDNNEHLFIISYNSFSDKNIKTNYSLELAVYILV